MVLQQYTAECGLNFECVLQQYTAECGPPLHPGTACERDVDECDIGSHDCNHAMSECVNTVGGYFCRCNHGYRLNGTSCRGMDRLPPPPHPLPLSPYPILSSSPHLSLPCLTPLPLHPPPSPTPSTSLSSPLPLHISIPPSPHPFPPLLHFPDVDECAMRIHNCIRTATCVNTIGSYTCVCPGNISCFGKKS